MQDPINMTDTDEAEQPTLPPGLPSESSSPAILTAAIPVLSEMHASALAQQCNREISNHRNGGPTNEQYGLELFRRAILLCDQDARLHLQHNFSEEVLSWLLRHPYREALHHFDSEKKFVAKAFERFWLVTSSNQQLEFSTLAGALLYLQASLNSTILDTLQASSKPKILSTSARRSSATCKKSLVCSDLSRNDFNVMRTMFTRESDQKETVLTRMFTKTIIRM